MIRSSIVVLLVVFTACMAGGCNSGPKAPSTDDAAALAAQAKQTTQKNIDAIQNNPSLSPDQKARIISHLTQPQQPLQPH